MKKKRYTEEQIDLFTAFLLRRAVDAIPYGFPGCVTPQLHHTLPASILPFQNSPPRRLLVSPSFLTS